MPWRALAYDDASLTAKLHIAEACGSPPMPALILVDAVSCDVRGSVRDRITADPEGFPWPRLPVEDLTRTMEFVSVMLTAVLFVDKMTSPDSDMVAALERVATPHFESVQGGSAATNIQFAIAREEDPNTDLVRQQLGFARDRDGPHHMRFAIVDVLAGKCYDLDNGGGKRAISEEELRSFVDAVAAGPAEPRIHRS